MSFTLTILPRAERDVQHIFNWIAERSPQGAKAWYAAFEDAARKATANPAGCPVASEAAQLNADIRQFLFKTRRGRVYRGVFKVAGNEVFLLRVRGPGQPPLAADELS
jgi:plasmid stabilization system protein ParE